MKDANMDKTIAMNKDGVASEVVAMLFGIVEEVFAGAIAAMLGEILSEDFVMFPRGDVVTFMAMLDVAALAPVENVMSKASTNKKKPTQTFAYMTVFFQAFLLNKIFSTSFRAGRLPVDKT